MDAIVESKVILKTAAYAAQSAKSPLAPFTIERRTPRPHDVLIDILYCGVCHSWLLTSQKTPETRQCLGLSHRNTGF